MGRGDYLQLESDSATQRGNGTPKPPGVSAESAHPELVNTDFESWAKESYEIASKIAYRTGARIGFPGKVRNGFVPLVRREVYRKLKGLEIDTCPFANLPEKKRTMWALTKEEMKNCRWLQPELVAQIELAEWTPDNHLRHSKFICLREDKEAREVVREKVMTKNH